MKIIRTVTLYLLCVGIVFAVLSVLDFATYKFLLYTEVFDTSELSFEEILRQEVMRIFKCSLITGIVTLTYFLTERKE